MPKTADCPECEYCCIIGLCCPPEAQRVRLTELFQERMPGASATECAQYAQVIVDARMKAQTA